MINQEIIIIILSAIVFFLIFILLYTRKSNDNKEHVNMPSSQIPLRPRCFPGINNYKSHKNRVDTLESLARTISLIDNLHADIDKSSFKKCIEMELDLIKSEQQSKE